MASTALVWVFSIVLPTDFLNINEGLYPCPMSSLSFFSKVELAVTSDGKTIVCYHPSVDIPYEHTRPIPQLDPLDYREETHDQMLKSRLDGKNFKNQQGPMIEELSKMFYTTKHRWYPVGQGSLNPPE
uniref:Large ribosomal subunit protein mL42 n=1 Tax=Podarcis muralis TaxID=64176 RepID=A0A670IVR2_PODMU